MKEEAEQKKSKKGIIIGAIASIVVIASVIYFMMTGKYESTDNAQLDGNILPVRSSITAFVERIRFADNQHVNAGDTLIEFDRDELDAKLSQAEALLDNAMANLKSAQNKLFASKENAEASQGSYSSSEQNVLVQKSRLEKAQKDYDRANELLKAKAMTQEQYDNTASALDVAKAEYARAISQKESTNSSTQGLRAQAQSDGNQIDLARALIKQREAEVELARKQLSYATVVAPCNGIVTKRAIQSGQYVTAGQSLCVVIDNEHFWVSANFKETQLENIQLGDEVEVKLDAFPKMNLKGKVESYSGATGAKFSLLPPDNSTGNFIKITQRFPIRISIDQLPQEYRSELFPGLSAFVKVSVK